MEIHPKLVPTPPPPYLQEGGERRGNGGGKGGGKGRKGEGGGSKREDGKGKSKGGRREVNRRIADARLCPPNTNNYIHHIL